MTFRYCGIHCSDIQVLSMADVFCYCAERCTCAGKLHGSVAQHSTSCCIAAGFGAQDIGLQSNFRGPLGQQGPYGSSGKPSNILRCWCALQLATRSHLKEAAVALAAACYTAYFLFLTHTALIIHGMAI